MAISSIIDRFSDRSSRKFRSSILLSLVFFYFAFHLVTGERGLLAYVQLKGEISENKQELTELQTEKERLANHVVGLRSESLDLDLLEEIARKDLGYSKKDEVVYFWE